jgi:hypothetical protein
VKEREITYENCNSLNFQFTVDIYIHDKINFFILIVICISCSYQQQLAQSCQTVMSYWRHMGLSRPDSKELLLQTHHHTQSLIAVKK